MQVLLLNNTFQPLSFISERKAIKLFFKDKVEVLTAWVGTRYFYGKGFLDLPAVLRMKYPIVRNFQRLVFSRGAVFKRDQFCCQYCGVALTPKTITLDHIIPKCYGGRNSFENCVSACGTCNRWKGTRSLEESGLKLLQEPTTPKGYLLTTPAEGNWHQSWNLFLNL